MTAMTTRHARPIITPTATPTGMLLEFFFLALMTGAVAVGGTASEFDVVVSIVLLVVVVVIVGIEGMVTVVVGVVVGVVVVELEEVAVDDVVGVVVAVVVAVEVVGVVVAVVVDGQTKALADLACRQALRFTELSGTQGLATQSVQCSSHCGEQPVGHIGSGMSTSRLSTSVLSSEQRH